MKTQVPDGYSPAATLSIALPDAEPQECYWEGCDQPAVVHFGFLAEDLDGERFEGFVFMCRTHMHGWLGECLDHGYHDPIGEL